MTRSVFGVRKRREERPELPLWGVGGWRSKAQVPLVPRSTCALQSGSAALPLRRIRTQTRTGCPDILGKGMEIKGFLGIKKQAGRNSYLMEGAEA